MLSYRQASSNHVPGASWDGVAAAGRHPIQLHIGSGGVVQGFDTSSGTEPMTGSIARVMDSAREKQCLNLTTLLIGCCEAGKSLWPAYSQIGCAVASQLEVQLKESMGVTDMSAPVQKGRSKLSGLARAQATHLAATRDKRLHQYFYASRASLEGQQCLGLCLDFSRTGNRKTGVGCVSSPQNVLSWCPPQAGNEQIQPRPQDTFRGAGFQGSRVSKNTVLRKYSHVV
jgi:hypothetical protein